MCYILQEWKLPKSFQIEFFTLYTDPANTSSMSLRTYWWRDGFIKMMTSFPAMHWRYGQLITLDLNEFFEKPHPKSLTNIHKHT